MEKFYAYLDRMKFIRRWQLMRSTRDENIMEHSHQVAVLTHALVSIENDDDMLRVLIPDVNHLFPDDPDCLSPYNLQNLPVNQLYIEKSHWRN